MKLTVVDERVLSSKRAIITLSDESFIVFESLSELKFIVSSVKPDDSRVDLLVVLPLPRNILEIDPFTFSEIYSNLLIQAADDGLSMNGIDVDWTTLQGFGEFLGKGGA